MSQQLSPLAGKVAPASILIDVARLVEDYSALLPDPSVAEQRVSFGTSGHRGCSSERGFNERHIACITQAICERRARAGVDGPLFIGLDSHALSRPAFETTLEVLAANGVEARVSLDDVLTPTPAVSRAILQHNRGRERGLADGIVITPSHNPPDSGGFKYNPTNGGPADTDVTRWVQDRANALLEADLAGVRRVPLARALAASTTRRFDFLTPYVEDLDKVVEFEPIRAAGVRIGVDPLGGAGVAYWPRIAERYRIDLTVVRTTVDPRFSFMTVDWDGKIRTDPSSAYAMQALIAMKDRFDVAFGCDADHDRHGIVTPSAGLMEPNRYLSVLFDYVFRHRPGFGAGAKIGKTVVTTALIDRVAVRLGRGLYEVPVGFKWFVAGLLDGTLGCGGEESAGASVLQRDGGVWSTDKDGLVPSLLAAEMTARGKDPSARYADLVRELGEPVAARIDVVATGAQKSKLGKLSRASVSSAELAGEPIVAIVERAPGNDAPIGGIKVSSQRGWFAARPSGTEAIYKIYAESFVGHAHLERLLAEAQRIIDLAIK